MKTKISAVCLNAESRVVFCKCSYLFMEIGFGTDLLEPRYNDLSVRTINLLTCGQPIELIAYTTNRT